jgi:hypothetical protein
MNSPTVETAPDHREDAVAQQELNDATLPVQHEVGLAMLVQLFAHWISLIHGRVAP